MAERTWVLAVPFEDRAIAQAAKARWDADMKAYVYTGQTLHPALTAYTAPAYSWESYQQDTANGTVTHPQAPAKRTLTPRPHQAKAATTILRAAKAGSRGFLLADDVGTGKTLSAALTVQHLPKVRPVRNVLIVCPLAVVPHWRRTLADVGMPRDMRIVVINYDRVKKLLAPPESAKTAKRTRTKNKRTAAQGIPLVQWDVVLMDEAHQCRHQTSQRSQAMARLARYADPAAKAPFVIWMSATAGQNPTELSYLSPLLAQVTGSRASALKDFGPWLADTRFHVTEDKRFKKWSWTDIDADREKDIARMRQLLFDRKVPVAMRRLPTDIAGWPEVNRILLPVDLTVEQHRMYEQVWTQFRHEMHLVRRGKNPSGGMVAQLRFRQKASLIRVGGTIDHALDLLDNGLQVAISVEFLESLDAIKAGLEKHKVSVAVMDGRTPETRESERLRFQTGQAKVVLFTPTEGFSLHQGEVLADGSRATNVGRATVVHDPRYSGIATIQLEGRCHRDGQFAPVYYAYSEGTVEERIVKTLLDRVASTKALVGDDTATIKALENLLTAGL